ncbi:MAG: efflux RND transporter periplasmic adaptor subunit, partial [Planctomycetota bacterium]
RVIRMDRVKIQALAPSDAVNNDMLGKPISVVLANQSNGSEFQGKITFINPEVNPATGLLQINAEVENTERKLRPGAKVTMTVNE